MTDQELEIFHFISHYQTVNRTRIAFEYHLTNAKVKNIISRINEELLPYAEIRSTSLGFFVLHVYDSLRFRELRDRLLYGSGELNTQRDRISSILLRMLNKDDYIRIDDLAEELFVSRRQLSKDLNLVRTHLEENGLKIVSVPHYGMKVEGDETKRRIALAHVFTAMSRTGKIDYQWVEEPELYKLIRITLRDTFFKLHSKISDYYFMSLVFHVYASVLRVKNGFTISPEDNDYPTGESAKYAAEEILKHVTEQTGIEFPESEICYLAAHLHAKSISFCVSSSRDHETITAVHSFLKNIDSRFGTEFDKDTDLINRLVIHMIPLRTRLYYGFQTKNVLMDIIYKDYLFEFLLARDSAGVLEKVFGVKLSEDEIGYIALNIGLSRRENHLIRDCRVLLVSGNGTALTDTLKHQLVDDLRISENSIDICSRWNLHYQTNEDYALVISTVPLYTNQKVPVYRCGWTLNENDIDTLRNIISDIIEPPLLYLFCPRELFMGETRFETGEEAIGKMLDHIQRVKGTDESFSEAISSSRAIFVGDTVLLASDRIDQDSIWACTAVNSRKIAWDTEHEIQVIIILSMKEGLYEEPRLVTKALSKLISNPKAVQDLEKHPDFRTFCEWIY